LDAIDAIIVGYHRWLPSGQGSPVQDTDAKRICAGIAAGRVPEAQTPDCFRMPFHQKGAIKSFRP